MEPTNRNHRILIMIIVVLATTMMVGGGIYFTMNKIISEKNSKIADLEKQSVASEKKEAVKTETKTEEKKTNQVKYNNAQYGFELVLPEAWKNYGVEEQLIDGAKVVYFGLPLKEENSDLQGFAKNFFSPFAITIQTKKQWETSQLGEGPDKGTKITENDTYVFSYSTGNGTADLKDLEVDEIIKDIKTIIATFKLN